MKPSKYVLLFAGTALAVTAASAFYLAKRKPASASTITAGSPSSAHTQAVPQVKPQETAQGTQSDNTAETATSFLGALTPSGTTESAGRERNYVVTYQVAFLRKAPAEKLPEESLTYQQLQAQASTLAPPVFYGQSVSGTYDLAHPESIAVRVKIDNKEVRGYIDAQKLWLEPSIATVDTPRYMVLKDGTAVHVVPDAGSPTVLSLLQGEVVEAVGKLDFRWGQWIKARFNGTERPRYGFMQASNLQALTVATVNQSAVAAEEIPRRISYSNVSLAEADRQKLSQNGFYIESIPPPAEGIRVDDMADAYQREGQPFITSDLFLHAHHLIFDRMLQDVEEEKISPPAARLAANLAHTTENGIKTLPAATPADVRDALTYDLLYFSVAAKLFDPGFAVPDRVSVDAQALVAQIEKAGGPLPSATSSKFSDEDFTQYKVRGHYEKNETLQRYFRAMMWFGRRNFSLADRKMTLC